MKEIQVCSNKGPVPLLRGDNPWGKGIQVCSNEGDCPSPREDNSETVKIN
jgi:hypothetical protein